MKNPTIIYSKKDLDIFLYANDTLIEGANICVKNYLYVPRYNCLREYLKGIREGNYKSAKIYIMKLKDKVIGAFVSCSEFEDFYIHIFIKKSFRNNGYGKILFVESLKDLIGLGLINKDNFDLYKARLSHTVNSNKSFKYFDLIIHENIFGNKFNIVRENILT